MTKLQENIEIQVLGIVEGIVKYWKYIIHDKSYITVSGNISESAINRIKLKIKDAQKQIKIIIPDKKERINLVEQSLLAVLDNIDFQENLSHLALLRNIVDDNLNFSEFPEFLKKTREQRGIKIVDGEMIIESVLTAKYKSSLNLLRERLDYGTPPKKKQINRLVKHEKKK